MHGDQKEQSTCNDWLKFCHDDPSTNLPISSKISWHWTYEWAPAPVELTGRVSLLGSNSKACKNRICFYSRNTYFAYPGNPVTTCCGVCV